MDEDTTKCIDERLTRLEKRIYSQTSSDPENKCIENLMNIQNKLQSSVTGKDKITLIFSKLNELEKYLNPSFKENITVNESVKANLILLDEESLRKTVDSLQTVKDLTQYLDSEHIRSAPALFPKLYEIAEVQKDLQEKSFLLSEETRNLIMEYDNLIATLSKQFILWDSLLTEIEKNKQAAKQITQ